MALYSEILITEQIAPALFQNLADRLVAENNAKIIEKINEFDSIYWDFKVNIEVVTLHLQTYIGISIYPKELDKATIEANQLVERIGFKLKYSNNQQRNWIVFKSGTEIEICFLLELIQEVQREKGKLIQTKFYESDFKAHEEKDCAICLMTLSGKDLAYFNKSYCICCDCFEQFIKIDDYLIQLERMDKIVKTAI
jgi:hypothetical protein